MPETVRVKEELYECGISRKTPNSAFSNTYLAVLSDKEQTEKVVHIARSVPEQEGISLFFGGQLDAVKEELLLQGHMVRLCQSLRVLLQGRGIRGGISEAGIALLRFLKRRKKFYYRPEHFVTVSGMLYRMKKNAHLHLCQVQEQQENQSGENQPQDDGPCHHAGIDNQALPEHHDADVLLLQPQHAVQAQLLLAPLDQEAVGFAMFTYFVFDLILRNDIMYNLPKGVYTLILINIGFWPS